MRSSTAKEFLATVVQDPRAREMPQQSGALVALPMELNSNPSSSAYSSSSREPNALFWTPRIPTNTWHTDTHTQKQTDRQTDTHTHTHTHTQRVLFCFEAESQTAQELDR